MHVLRSCNKSFQQFGPKFVISFFSFVANGVEDFFNFVNIDDFLARACDGPVLQKPEYQWNAQACLLLNVDFDTVLELSVKC